MLLPRCTELTCPGCGDVAESPHLYFAQNQTGETEVRQTHSLPNFSRRSVLLLNSNPESKDPPRSSVGPEKRFRVSTCTSVSRRENAQLRHMHCKSKRVLKKFTSTTARLNALQRASGPLRSHSRLDSFRQRFLHNFPKVNLHTEKRRSNISHISLCCAVCNPTTSVFDDTLECPLMVMRRELLAGQMTETQRRVYQCSAHG